MAEPGGLRSATQASMTTSALPVTLSSTEQVERCGWQVTREKFLWEGEPETILEEKAILGRGTVGEVQEVIAKSSQEFMVRKCVFVRRQNAQRVRNKTETKNQHLKLLEHTHMVKVLGCYGKWINGVTKISTSSSTTDVQMLSVVVGESIKQLRKFLFDDPTILQPYHEVVESRPRDENPVQQLMSSYLCLALTLAYMHAKYVNVHDFGAEDIMASDTAIQFCSFKIWIARQMPLSKGSSSKDSVSAKQGMFYLGLVFPELLAAITRELPWPK
ncbi:hypothetical protein N0V95_005937 [Ascochyta clinopodiicola]|nr:hypothetical protein N0V95_005937 [Ascochyta clinopodiicola]